MGWGKVCRFLFEGCCPSLEGRRIVLEEYGDAVLDGAPKDRLIDQKSAGKERQQPKYDERKEQLVEAKNNENGNATTFIHADGTIVERDSEKWIVRSKPKQQKEENEEVKKKNEEDTCSFCGDIIFTYPNFDYHNYMYCGRCKSEKEALGYNRCFWS